MANPNRAPLPGKFVWFEHVSKDAKRAQGFYGEVLGWRVQAFPMGAFTYEMILTGEALDTMIGGYAAPKHERQPSHWISYVSVEDVDAAAKLATANGGKVLEAPYDTPEVGRMARIADPQGAELCLFKSINGDPPDTQGADRRFFWNELHTSDPQKALAFYEKVVGFSHRGMDMGPGGVYHIVSKGGVERGGVTHHLQSGAAPHWLPYVSVDDTDATIARAKKNGATIPMPPEDIPGVGRFGVLQDPTGALLAIMKPLPRQQQG
jgi:predicted enzyme related to lactoylglutathione lyase